MWVRTCGAGMPCHITSRHHHIIQRHATSTRATPCPALPCTVAHHTTPQTHVAPRSQYCPPGSQLPRPTLSHFLGRTRSRGGSVCPACPSAASSSPHSSSRGVLVFVAVLVLVFAARRLLSHSLHVHLSSSSSASTSARAMPTQWPWNQRSHLGGKFGRGRYSRKGAVQLRGWYRDGRMRLCVDAWTAARTQCGNDQSRQALGGRGRAEE